MNNIVSTFAKFVACAGIVIGAPILAAHAVSSITDDLNAKLEVMSCKRIAQLDQVDRVCE